MRACEYTEAVIAAYAHSQRTLPAWACLSSLTPEEVLLCGCMACEVGAHPQSQLHQPVWLAALQGLPGKAEKARQKACLADVHGVALHVPIRGPSI